MRNRQVLPSSAYTFLFGFTSFSISERISVSMPSFVPRPVYARSATPVTSGDTQKAHVRKAFGDADVAALAVFRIEGRTDDQDADHSNAQLTRLLDEPRADVVDCGSLCRLRPIGWPSSTR
jgi:hypothetical protein